MRHITIIAAILYLLTALGARAAAPVVSNLEVRQLPGQDTVEIIFDVADADGDMVQLVPMFSGDGGLTWPVRCDSLSGDIYVAPGTAKTILWYPAGNFEDFQGQNCRIRLFALDGDSWPTMEFFRIEGEDLVPLATGIPDTVGFGRPYGLAWQALDPTIEGLDPLMVAEMDTVGSPYDGILGYKWRYLGDHCIPQLEDCWHPRYYDASTGDSISYWGANSSLGFSNDGSGLGVFRQLLPSGEYSFRVNAVNLIQNEVPQYLQEFDLVVNYDPETYLLNGETDWAHPEDPEVYPYYVLLNDPAQQHHPFVAGDRIPDRSYVVFKGLFRDDPRDAVYDPGYEVGGVGRFVGVRENFSGGTYSFQSQYSILPATPTWPADFNGWSADTLGFMVGPRTEFTFEMAAIDEHGRRDGTPASLSFDVGIPPCVQCVEILPGGYLPSAYGPDLDCLEDGASHPCATGEVPEFHIKSSSGPEYPGRTYLDPAPANLFLAVSKATLEVSRFEEEPDPEMYYIFPAQLYEVSVLVHGQDDPREAWADPLSRMMGLRYQVDYECDPDNTILDGSSFDDLDLVAWGEEYGNLDLDIDNATGLWRIRLQVAVPQMLVQVGRENFRMITALTQAGGDFELADQLVHLVTRQLGEGQVRVSAVDQARCNFVPIRPALYHVFPGVRPPASGPGSGTWRDCNPFFPVDYSLELHRGAMLSHQPGEEMARNFRIVLQDLDGADVVCEEGPPLR